MQLASRAARRRVGVAAAVIATVAMAAPVGAQVAATAAAPPQLDAKLLKPMTAAYAVTAQGNPFGTNTVTIVQDGDAWVVKNVLDSDMFAQNTESRVKAADLAPVSFKLTMTGNGMQASAEISVANGKVSGSADLPDQMGGKKTFDLAAPAGMLLPGFAPAVLGIVPLQVGQSIALNELSLRSGAPETTTLKVTGEEKVTVPAGAFDTYRIDAGGEQPSTIWVRKDAPHVVVKQEMQMFPVVFELKTLQ